MFFLFKSRAVAHMGDSNEPRGVPGPDPGPSGARFYCTPKWSQGPHAHCEKVTGERDTSVCHRGSTGPAQHPEVGARPGTSAPCLMSITVDEGLRVGLH